MSAGHFRFRSLDSETTRLVARRLGEVLPEVGITISMIGPLGAGKTHFIKGLAEGLGIDPNEVSSPTFTLVNEYRQNAGLQLIHADFYRVESENALEEVGFLELSSPGKVLAVEWGDRFADFLPRDRLDVEIIRPSENAGQQCDEREMQVSAHGPLARDVLGVWARKLDEIGIVEARL